MASLNRISNHRKKFEQFYQLHHKGSLLVLPNIWDPLGAILLESMGYPAIATASASVAFSNGYDDGELIPFEELLAILKRIVKSVNLPVSADIESGYAKTEEELKGNISKLLEAGITGINIEDTDKHTGLLLPVETQCRIIGLIRAVAGRMDLPIFINARADVYIRGNDFTTARSKLDETIRRGLAYKEAGADCFFPIAMKETEEIKEVLSKVQMPVNVSLLPGIADLNELEKMGVARVSLGPSLLKIAIRGMHELLLKLKKLEGLSDITGNEITTVFVKDLVNKKYSDRSD